MGRTYQLGRITLTFKTTEVDNAGAYTLCETIEPPGSGAGLHRHSTYDETHIICAGRLECERRDTMHELDPGDREFARRGTHHSDKTMGQEAGRELNISSPGGIFDA